MCATGWDWNNVAIAKKERMPLLRLCSGTYTCIGMVLGVIGGVKTYVVVQRLETLCFVCSMEV